MYSYIILQSGKVIEGQGFLIGGKLWGKTWHWSLNRPLKVTKNTLSLHGKSTWGRANGNVPIFFYSKPGPSLYQSAQQKIKIFLPLAMYIHTLQVVKLITIKNPNT